MTTHAIERLEDAALEFAVASRLTSYPEGSFVQALQTLAHVEGALRPGWEQLLQSAELRAGVDDLRGEYNALFGSQKERVPLYETEFGRMRGMAKGTELADLQGFYQAFGLNLTTEAARRDLPDHVAVQLEFYAVLLARQAELESAGDEEGREILLDARKKFLEAHLGRFVSAIAGQPAVANHPVYGPVFQTAAGIVDDECRALGVRPDPLDFYEKGSDGDEVTCGAANSLCSPVVTPSR